MLARSDAEWRQAYRQSLIRQGFCPVCGDVNNRAPKYMCSDCLKTENERKLIWAKNRVAEGKCPHCKNKTMPGKAYCEECKDKRVKWNRERRRRRKSRETSRKTMEGFLNQSIDESERKDCKQ
jgi:NMD protein affecting ribosome stability and mRNA decay